MDIRCLKCGTTNENSSTTSDCTACGHSFAQGSWIKVFGNKGEGLIRSYERSGATEGKNTSGSGKQSDVPHEIKRWNWGAFLFPWVWGLGNGVPIALLAFIPAVNIGISIYLGINGNELAWRYKRWNSIAHFFEVQRTWTNVGLCFIGLTVFLLIVLILVGNKAAM